MEVGAENTSTGMKVAVELSGLNAIVDWLTSKLEDLRQEGTPETMRPTGPSKEEGSDAVRELKQRIGSKDWKKFRQHLDVVFLDDQGGVGDTHDDGRARDWSREGSNEHDPRKRVEFILDIFSD